MGKPTFTSTPAASIWPDQIRGRRLELGSFKPAGDKNPPNAKILPVPAINSKVTNDNVSSQVSGEKKTGLTSVLTSSTRPSILKRSGSLPSVNNSGREVLSDPVAAANEMWAEKDAAERLNKTADSASKARQGEDKVRLCPEDEPSSTTLVVKAEVHDADQIRTVDETRSDEGVFTTARETQVPPENGTEERHPQNQMVIDLSEEEVQLGRKATDGSESKESTLVSDSLINQIENWQTTKVSEPMSYRSKTDAYDSEQESDKEKDSFGLYD